MLHPQSGKTTKGTADHPFPHTSGSAEATRLSGSAGNLQRIAEIKSVVREAGARSKIAVYAMDDELDAVGACVGPKGQRGIIVDELHGEKNRHSEMG